MIVPPVPPQSRVPKNLVEGFLVDIRDFIVLFVET